MRQTVPITPVEALESMWRTASTRRWAGWWRRSG